MRWIILTEFLAGTANKLLSLESQAPRDSAEFTNLKTTVEEKIQFKMQMTHESKSSTQPVQKTPFIVVQDLRPSKWLCTFDSLKDFYIKAGLRHWTQCVHSGSFVARHPSCCLFCVVTELKTQMR